MNHMNGRVEDAVTGRFLSADPNIPDPSDTQSYNRHSYGRNNPLTRIDATGFTDIYTQANILDGFGGGGSGDGGGGGSDLAGGTAMGWQTSYSSDGSGYTLSGDYVTGPSGSSGSGNADNTGNTGNTGNTANGDSPGDQGDPTSQAGTNTGVGAQCHAVRRMHDGCGQGSSGQPQGTQPGQTPGDQVPGGALGDFFNAVTNAGDMTNAVNGFLSQGFDDAMELQTDFAKGLFWTGALTTAFNGYNSEDWQAALTEVFGSGLNYGGGALAGGAVALVPFLEPAAPAAMEGTTALLNGTRSGQAVAGTVIYGVPNLKYSIFGGVSALICNALPPQACGGGM